MGIFRKYLSIFEGAGWALFIVGVGSFFVLPNALVHAVQSVVLNYKKPAPPIIAETRAFAVRSRDSKLFGPEPIGWLEISYPESICEDEEEPLTVTYRAAPNGPWSRRYSPGWSSGLQVRSLAASNDRAAEIGYPTLRLAVSAENLKLSPVPLSYEFNNAQIAESGSDQATWMLSPQKAGHFAILMKFTAAPSAWRVEALRVNGVSSNSSASNPIPLFVQVNTIYRIPQIYLQMIEALGGLVSFVLTLPALHLLFDWYVKRGLARHAAHAPALNVAPSRDGRNSGK